MRARKDIQSVARKPNYKKAECLGQYGYGNGRTRSNFCQDKCPVFRQCWKETVAKGITRYFPPSDVLEFNSILEKWMRKYPDKPKKARRLAMKEVIEKGKYDPYLQIVVLNTQQGVADQPDPMRQFRGGLWQYHGAIAAYHA
jgi:hypothetical protein